MFEKLLLIMMLCAGVMADDFDWKAAMARGETLKGEALAAWFAELPPQASERVIAEVKQRFDEASKTQDEKILLNLANNYAVFLLRQERAREASELLFTLYKWTNVEKALAPHEAAWCYFNLGRAFELSDDPKKAARWYHLSETMGGTRLGWKRLADLALHSRDNKVWEIALMSAAYTAEAGRGDRTEPFLRACLEQKDRENLVALFERGFMTRFTDWLLIQEVRPKAFMGQWAEPLAGAWKMLGIEIADWDTLKPLTIPEGIGQLDEPAHEAALLLAAYSGGYHHSFSDRQRQARALRDLDDRKTARLLEKVGVEFFQEKHYVEAANLFRLAWTLDGDRNEPALYLSKVMLAAGKEVDPEGRELDWLVQDTVRGKNNQYLRGDLKEIYRYHVLLGTLFQDMGVWDTEGKKPYWGAREQWYRATKVAGRLAAEDAFYKYIPGVHESLARAFLNSKELSRDARQQSAWDAYTTATEDYLALGRVKAAQLAYMERGVLGMSPSSKDAESRLVQKLFKDEAGGTRAARKIADWLNFNTSGGKIGKDKNIKEELKQPFLGDLEQIKERQIKIPGN